MYNNLLIKPTKLKLKKPSNDTLILQHNNMLNKFTSDKNNISLITEKINNIKPINELNDTINTQDLILDYNKNIELENLKSLKSNIETSNNEIEYFSNSLDILEKYYNSNIKKNQNNILNNLNMINSKNIYLLNSYNKNTDINNIYWEESKNKKSNDISQDLIIKTYNNIINNKPINQYYDYTICPYCQTNKTINNNDGLIICTNCGNVEKILIETELPNYKNNNIDKPIYPYKRLNHFMECLNQFQAKENINIPEKIYNKIINELKSRRINDLSKITLNDTRYILKQLKLNKYYEHVSFIYSKISGNPPPHLTYDQENKLKILFKRIDKSFNKFCPYDRRNFFNYNYLLHKLFQLINLNQYLDYFPLLKSKEKLFKQDEIWKLVCKDLNIIYIPN